MKYTIPTCFGKWRKVDDRSPSYRRSFGNNCHPQSRAHDTSLTASSMAHLTSFPPRYRSSHLHPHNRAAMLRPTPQPTIPSPLAQQATNAALPFHRHRKTLRSPFGTFLMQSDYPVRRTRFLPLGTYCVADGCQKDLRTEDWERGPRCFCFDDM
jgi:hypothetical protein